MQHQSQDPAKGLNAGTTGSMFRDAVVSSEEIERHIAEGKRLQAEAIAAFLRGCSRRIGAVFQRPTAGPSESAVPHRA